MGTKRAPDEITAGTALGTRDEAQVVVDIGVKLGAEYVAFHKS